MHRTAYKNLPPLGKLIAKCLFDNGISQRQLAKAAGISAQHLSKIIIGQSEPQLKTIKKLSTALGIPFDDFIVAYKE